MAICLDCKKEMTKAKTCSPRFEYIKIDGEVFRRNTSYFDFNERCHDCGIENKPGNLHHFGCDMERCPRCGRQLISCDCKKEAIGAGEKWYPVS